jgi:hypothetical protein
VGVTLRFTIHAKPWNIPLETVIRVIAPLSREVWIIIYELPFGVKIEAAAVLVDDIIYAWVSPGSHSG